MEQVRSRHGGDTEQALFYTLFKRNQSREADSVNGIKVSPESPMDREIRKKEESYSKCSAPKNSGQWKFGFSSSIGFKEVGGLKLVTTLIEVGTNGLAIQ